MTTLAAGENKARVTVGYPRFFSGAPTRNWVQPVLRGFLRDAAFMAAFGPFLKRADAGKLAAAAAKKVRFMPLPRIYYPRKVFESHFECMPAKGNN
ncbi:hypothetical protein [Dyella japonica]|uniref:Uncharacterized protein n=1 Tax=Dyella japonica TaxID=231455 RepID=A0ABV2JPN4_9GAMM